MSDDPAPNVHPCENLTTPDDQQVEIDTEMVPLVKTLWTMKLATVASCQDIGESAAGLRTHSAPLLPVTVALWATTGDTPG
ncbi:MAG: hypothetical protein LC808_42250 [Actinobacteria bacterium]|nr:hypothetical protein [Actinomycetota bacterium]